ncbi:MarR family winged helix-turn-helix transcriptional regulator [Mesorhizobium sp. 10J20-29]
MVEDVVRSLGHLCLGTRMKRIGERLQAETQRIMDTLDVPVQAGQYPLLGAVDRLGPLTVGELAEAIGVTQPGATRAAGQLVKAGLLDMRSGRDDQRVRILSLTASGQKLVDDAKRDVWPHIEAAVADLCGELSGPLLDQLAGLEDSLAETPLVARSGAKARRP